MTATHEGVENERPPQARITQRARWALLSRQRNINKYTPRSYGVPNAARKRSFPVASWLDLGPLGLHQPS